MLGFSETDQALMIALYIAMDSFGTACNVTGDGFIALIVDRIFRPKAKRRRYRLLNMRPVKPSHLQTVHSSQTAPYRARFIRRIMPEQQSPRIMTAKNFLGDVFLLTLRLTTDDETKAANEVLPFKYDIKLQPKGLQTNVFLI